MKLIVLSLVLSFCAFAHQHEKTATDPKMKEMMEKFKEYSTPSDGHKTLAGLAGKWSHVAKSWHSADAKPEESKGSSVMKMILGGRFLQHEVSGKVMGQPYMGLGITGYNNLKKEYETLWLDNMATGMMHGHGSFDAETKTLTEKGEFTCPMKKEASSEYRSEWKLIDKNNMIYSMYGAGMDGDKEFKMMEITYKRK